MNWLLRLGRQTSQLWERGPQLRRLRPSVLQARASEIFRASEYARLIVVVAVSALRISTRVELQADPDNPRGLKPLDVSCMLEEGAKQNGTTYELYAVVQHLGATPFSGHYVACRDPHEVADHSNLFVTSLCAASFHQSHRYCWHPPSCSWWCFDDSSVRRVDASRTARSLHNYLGSLSGGDSATKWRLGAGRNRSAAGNVSGTNKESRQPLLLMACTK